MKYTPNRDEAQREHKKVTWQAILIVGGALLILATVYWWFYIRGCLYISCSL